MPPKPVSVDQEPNPHSREERIGLIHILTPEFHKLDTASFDDIPEEAVAAMSADELQLSLYWQYVKVAMRRREEEVAAFSYPTPKDGIISVALTPDEHDRASESPAKLGERVYRKNLAKRDRALRNETGDKSARARDPEDIRIAKRDSFRAVMRRQTDMEVLLEEDIKPKIVLIDKFVEMSEGSSINLARGTRESVSKRFEELRETIFDDMLDAIALQKDWSDEMTAEAKRVLQKRLYISGDPKNRVANFREMTTLAKDYYGHKLALILTKIADAKKYLRKHPEIVADIKAIDEERRIAKAEKAAAQLLKHTQ